MRKIRKAANNNNKCTENDKLSSFFCSALADTAAAAAGAAVAELAHTVQNGAIHSYVIVSSVVLVLVQVCCMRPSMAHNVSSPSSMCYYISKCQALNMASFTLFSLCSLAQAISFYCVSMSLHISRVRRAVALIRC